MTPLPTSIPPASAFVSCNPRGFRRPASSDAPAAAMVCKASRWLAGAAVVLAAAAAGCGSDGQEAAPSRATVTVVVDKNGVPHVYAPTDEDAFWGAGYMMARDRPYQLEMTRRHALGRLAEVLGNAALADDRLARLFGWRVAAAKDAERVRAENAEAWRMIGAWTAGVNARVAELRAPGTPAPYGFDRGGARFVPEPWSETDVLAVAKMTAFGNDLSIDREIFATIASRLYPDAMKAVELLRPAHAVFALPPEDRPPGAGASWRGPPQDPEAGRAPAPAPAPPYSTESWDALERLRVAGSNNWAIDGRHTASGRPLLANDPHQGFQVPGIFYLLHMNSADAGGTLDVAGFSFVGAPGVSLGQTRRVAWAATTSGADVMDLWEAKPADDGVRLGGKVFPLVDREEKIIVRGDADPPGSGDVDVLDVQDVPGVGVVLPPTISPIPVAGPGRILVLGWTGYSPRTSKGLLGLVRSRSVADVEAAIDQFESMNFNFVYADASGIGYRVGLEVPVRAGGAAARPWLVMDGEDPAAQWTGASLAREKLPRSRAAARGWIATANNDPFGFTANGRVDDDPWYYAAMFDPGWRAKRLEDEVGRLVKQGKVTTDDVKKLQGDLHDGLAADVLPALADAWAAVGTDPALAAWKGRADMDALAALLGGWDRRMHRDSAGALAFHAFAHLLAEEAVKDDVPLVYGPAIGMQAPYVLKIPALAIAGAYPASDAILQGGKRVVLVRALDRTAKWIATRFGAVAPPSYRLSDMKVTSFRDSLGPGLDEGTRPTDGGETTVNVSPSGFYEKEAVAPQWRSHFGPVFRMVFSFADDGTPEMEFDAPLGNHADPADPHARDLLDDWVEARHRRMPFRRAEVDAAAEARIVLVREKPAP